MVNAAEGELRRWSSLFRSALVVAALGVGAVMLASTIGAQDSAYARGHDNFEDAPDDLDEPDIDEPDFDEPDFDEPDFDEVDFEAPDADTSSNWEGADVVDIDINHSGPGNAGDFDDSHDFDSSGPGGGDDDGLEAHGGDADFNDYGSDPHAGNAGRGNDDDDDNDRGDRDNSSPGSSNSGHAGLGDESSHVSGLFNEHALYSVEYDSHGAEHVPGELVFVGVARDFAAASNLGFGEIAVQSLASGGIMARLSTPAGVNIDAAIAMLAHATPDALVTPNNIYRSAQSYRIATTRASTRRPMRARGVLGVIDTGVDVASLPSAGAGPEPTGIRCLHAGRARTRLHGRRHRGGARRSHPCRRCVWSQRRWRARRVSRTDRGGH